MSVCSTLYLFYVSHMGKKKFPPYICNYIILFTSLLLPSAPPPPPRRHHCHEYMRHVCVCGMDASCSESIISTFYVCMSNIHRVALHMCALLLWIAPPSIHTIHTYICKMYKILCAPCAKYILWAHEMFEQRLCKFDDDIEKLMCMHTHRKAVNVWENEICIDNLVLDTLPKLYRATNWCNLCWNLELLIDPSIYLHLEMENKPFKTYWVQNFSTTH